MIGNDSYVYCKINKGMYCLKLAAHFAYDDLVEHLSKYRYQPDTICQNIFGHTKQEKQNSIYVLTSLE